MLDLPAFHDAVAKKLHRRSVLLLVQLAVPSPVADLDELKAVAVRRLGSTYGAGPPKTAITHEMFALLLKCRPGGAKADAEQLAAVLTGSTDWRTAPSR